jgi:hypothetical protein
LLSIRLEGFVQPEQGHADEGSEQVMARVSSSYRFHDDLRHFSLRSGPCGPAMDLSVEPVSPLSTEALDRNARTVRQPGR